MFALSQVYSIQEAKLLAEEDFKRSEAEKKQDKVRKMIKDLVNQFETLKKKNDIIDEYARLSEAEMSVDPDYVEMLNQRVEEDLDETKEELKWDAEYFQLRTKVRGRRERITVTHLSLVKETLQLREGRADC